MVFPYWMIWPCHHVCTQSRNWQLSFWGWALPDVKPGLQLLALFDLQCPEHFATLSQLWIKLSIGRWLLKLHGLCLRRNFCQSLSLSLKVWASAGKQQGQKFLIHFELCPPRSCVTVILSLEEILKKQCDSNVAVNFWCFYAVHLNFLPVCATVEASFLSILLLVFDRYRPT